MSFLQLLLQCRLAGIEILRGRNDRFACENLFPQTVCVQSNVPAGCKIHLTLSQSSTEHALSVSCVTVHLLEKLSV